MEFQQREVGLTLKIIQVRDPVQLYNTMIYVHYNLPLKVKMYSNWVFNFELAVLQKAKID